MDIRIIRTDKNIISTFSCGDRILELSSQQKDNASFLNLAVYFPKSNSCADLLSGIPEDSWIPVSDCIWDSKDFYCAVSRNDQTSTYVTVYKYSYSDNDFAELFSVSADSFSFGSRDRIRIFILTEDQILVQTECQKDSNTQALMGNIEFTQTLYNISTGESSSVKDPNLINNGIHSIIPVSATDIMMKTGFSSIEDSRIDISSESDALIESVFFGSLAMFISSAFRDKATISYKLLSTAYFDKGILSPKVKGSYIFFTVLDYKSSSSETVFYNFVTDETLKCINDDASSDDLQTAYVIGDRPYIRSSYPDRTEFFNVRTSETDSIFYDEHFYDVTGSLFILGSDKKRGSCIKVYRSPGNDLILKEHGSYAASCMNSGSCYIYISAK